MKLNGGFRRSNRRRIKGGGITDLVPSSVTNLGRELMYNTSSAYSSLTGADQPQSPNPQSGHLTASINANRVII